MAKKYFTTTKTGELVNVEPDMAKELVRIGKKKPEDFKIEDDLTPIPNKEVKQSVPTQKSKTQMLWESLKKPEELSREGLTGIAEMLPESGTTRSVPLNALIGTPRVAAETLADVAPSFVSRESILAAGASPFLKKAIPIASKVVKPIGRYIGKTAEEISGLTYRTPGVLAETFKDPSLLFAKGKESARKLYEAAKGQSAIRSELAVPMSKTDFVNRALELAKNGELTALEALEARKELGMIKKSIPGEAFRVTREIFDDIAKTKFDKADLGYARAVKADEMRRFTPINKTGSPSLLKGGVMSILPKAVAATLSPAVQGATAATLGAGAKLGTSLLNVPTETLIAAASLSARLKEFANKKENR